MNKLITITAILVLFSSFEISAQKEAKTIKIQTSAQCEMCKESIEKAMAFEKGVVNSELDMETKELEVKYKPKKTSPEKIRKAISEIGYDADDVKANPRVYEKLEACCKKPEDR